MVRTGRFAVGDRGSWASRLLKRPICVVVGGEAVRRPSRPFRGSPIGALGRTLNVQGVRLACGRRAPPRIWTFDGGPRYGPPYPPTPGPPRQSRGAPRPRTVLSSLRVSAAR